MRDVHYRFTAPRDEAEASPPTVPTADGAVEAVGVAASPTAPLGFALGPLTLTIARGETWFIVGENGCGKTTLIKLLLGLYPPDAGQLLVDGVPLASQEIDAYRQLFSVVFSDYHLFDTLVPREARLSAEAEHYLKRLAIARKVSIRTARSRRRICRPASASALHSCMPTSNNDR